MTTITWSAILDSSDAPCVTRHTTQILALVEPDAQDAAGTAFKWWMEDDTDYSMSTNWDMEVGEQETTATAIVIIHEPPELAGSYDVTLQREIVARGYIAEPERIARAEAILAKQERAA